MDGSTYFFYSPESHAKGEEPVMGDRERLFLEILKKVARERHIQLQANFRVGVSSKKSAGTKATGFAITLSKKAKLSHFVTKEGKTLFPARWFSRTVVLEVPESAMNPNMTEEDIRNVVAGLTDELSGSKEGLQSHLAHMESRLSNPTNHNDSCRWHTCIGSHGDVSVRRRAGEGFSRPVYYITVRTDSGVFGEALCHYILESPKATLEQFFDSSLYRDAEAFSKRLSRRLVAIVIDRLALNITLGEDRLAFVDESKQEAYPLMYTGKLTADTVSNRFVDPSSTGLTLFYYGGVERIEHSTEYTHVASMQGSRSGVALYPIQEGIDYTRPSARTYKNGNSFITMEQENPYRSFPVDIGKLLAEKDAPSNKDLFIAANLDRTAVSKLHERHFWRGREALPVGAPITEESAIKALNSRLYTHRAPSRLDLVRNEFIMNSQEHSSAVQLKTVASIIPPDEQ